ncbi:MAG: hypothetical protein HW386_459 [Gammaproteobacteria bacterium]|nr:hypothetical protein [Gammaproteobacteria bacterium]
MTIPEQTEQLQLPTRKNILISTALAALVAAVLLLTIVLPVEYGIDPTGVGARLGLSAIAAANTGSSPAQQLPEVPLANAGSEQFAQSTDVPFRIETIEIPMQGDEELEYKFDMQKGQMLMYTWSSGTTEMYFEFHAEPTEGDYPEDYFMSYQIGDGSTGGNGTLVAPFTGKHGWYFLNLTENPVTVKLEVSGYYTSHGRLITNPE